MQFPITIGLHRSRLQIPFFVLLALVAAIIILLLAWPLAVQLALLVGLGLYLVFVLRKLSHPIQELRLSKDGQLSIRFRGKEETFFPVIIQPGVTVHPLLTVLSMEYEAHHLLLVITPDCLAAEDFRRLRVWLKWQAILGEPDGDG